MRVCSSAETDDVALHSGAECFGDATWNEVTAACHHSGIDWAAVKRQFLVCFPQVREATRSGVNHKVDDIQVGVVFFTLDGNTV